MTPTALIIEDNAQNRYLATFLLEGSGFEVLSAVDGARGLVLARENKPNVILLDIQLPGMDGYEVARRIRQDAMLQDIPVIAVTSYAMGGDREKALGAGCNGYLEKPIDPETFVADVRAFLGEKPV